VGRPIRKPAHEFNAVQLELDVGGGSPQTRASNLQPADFDGAPRINGRPVRIGLGPRQLEPPQIERQPVDLDRLDAPRRPSKSRQRTESPPGPPPPHSARGAGAARAADHGRPRLPGTRRSDRSGLLPASASRSQAALHRREMDQRRRRPAPAARRAPRRAASVNRT
jgi:hypothetical protein